MGEGSDKTELRGNREQGDWVHRKGQNKPSILDANVPRRGLLGLAGAAAIAFAAKRFGLIDDIPDPREALRRQATKEQEEAFRISEDPEKRAIYGIAKVTLKKPKDGKPSGVNMMNRPTSYQSNDEAVVAQMVHTYDEQITFTDAVRVIGTDPRIGGLRGTEDSWLYVKDPNDLDNPAKGGFIHGDKFEWDPAIFDRKNAVRLTSFKNS